eukprot:2002729-Pleurochrysis_carterae.AAC.1
MLILRCNASRESPPGVPLIADFATEVGNSSRARFDPVAAQALVNETMDRLSDIFTQADEKLEKCWNGFFENYPKEPADIAEE